LDSVEAHNADGLPFCVSVPSEDRRPFLDRLGTGRFELFTDEQIRGKPELSGWTDQQVVKLSFWKLGRASASLVVDSDFQFLRDFRRSDLIDADGTPFLVASPCLNHWESGEPATRAAFRGEGKPPVLTRAQIADYAAQTREPARPSWLGRLRRFRVEREFDAWWGRPGRPVWYMPGPILSQRVQESFYREFMRPRRLTYGQLIQSYFYEYNWLGEWALASRVHDLRPIPPTFAHFVSDEGIVEARSQGVTRETIARGYLGVCLSARHQQIMEL
jgi:hypothetical protein